MAQAQPRQEASRAGPGQRRPAILVVDDNRANLEAMSALLASMDLDVTPAPSGEDALRMLLQRDFAVVLMDVQMPGLDGFQTTELIRQRDRTRDVPIIFVTAIFTDDESAKKAYSLGAIDFLTKPFDDSVLKAKVAALIAHHRQLDVIERQAEALRLKQRETDRANAAREAAEAANRAKDEFLAMLSHELRAPLHAILGWASLLETDASVAPTSAKAAETIARAARAQSKLIDELLDVSTIVAGKMTIEKRAVDLGAVVANAIAAAEATAAEKGIRIDLTVAPGALTVRGDARRLEQLVGHLLSNAVKFSAEGAAVAVELARDERELRLRVQDYGIGISAEFLPFVFERFRQADGTRTRRHGGLGIGLTVARALAELHGGTLAAFSDGLGKGAELLLKLPIAERTDTIDPPAAPPAEATASVELPAAASAEAPLAGLRLLVVDDDQDALELLAEILQKAGAAVVTASSAASGLAAFAAGRFDVLVSDLGMPGEDGLTLMQKIRAIDAGRGGNIVAIAVSGYGSADDVAASRRAGFDAHLVKPCDSTRLVELLARFTRAA
ncbi:MAG TPA: response regulator [Polyangia bacterium]